jgi:hypothetical protein
LGGRDYIDVVPEEDRRDENPEEQEADRFAQDLLISPADYESFTARGEITAQSIRSFAQEQGIAAGIVVGRLQREGKVPSRSHFNTLKKRIVWPR